MKYLLALMLACASFSSFAQQPIGSAEGYDSGGTLNGVTQTPIARAAESSPEPFDIQIFGENAYGRALWNRGAGNVVNPVVARAQGTAQNRTVEVDGLVFTATKVTAYAFSQGNCLGALTPDYHFEITGLVVTADGQPSVIPNPIPVNTTIDYGNGRSLLLNHRSTSGDGINTLEVRIIGAKIVTPDTDYNLGYAVANVNCQNVPVELQSFRVD